jgi:cytochrome c553
MAGTSGMKRRTAKFTVLTIIAVFDVGLLSAQESLPVRNCTWCHGSSAQGYTTAPRLAGQKPDYIENSLLNFRTHVRDNPYSKQYMWGAAANVSEEMAHGFGLYFSNMSPAPANDGNGALVNEGKSIYVEGIPESNVVSCIVCHGPNAEGFEGIPRLGGMGYAYLKRRLKQWNEGFDSTAVPMPQVTKNLSEIEIEALASYLSFLR